MSFGVVGVQFQGASVFGLGVDPVPLFLQHSCEEYMGSRKVRIEFQRFSGCADYSRARLVRGSTDKNGAETVGSSSQPDVSRRKCWVHLYGALEISDAVLHSSPAAALVQNKTSLHVALIYFGRDGTRRSAWRVRR